MSTATPRGCDQWPSRRQPATARRHRQGAGLVRVLRRPVGRRVPVGGDAAVAASVRPHRARSTCRRRGRSTASQTVITADDVPGKPTYGLISRTSRCSPATSCATSASRSPRSPPTTPRRAGGRWRRSSSSTRCSTPLTDPERGHRRQPSADPPATATSSAISESCAATSRSSARSSSRARTRSGMQDQAFLGLEAALAMPDPGGAGVDLFVATQWLHEDRDQIAACLDLAPEKVRLTLGGVGGAFGAREDISLQVHTCLLALRTGRPVRIAYSREESFLGHVHRHPATIWMRHHATPRRRDPADRGPHGARRRRLRVDVVGRADQRHHPHAGAVQVRSTPRSTATRCAPTTCRAGRCAASASCRPASPTRDRWTSWPRRAASTRSRSACCNAMETGDRLITGQVDRERRARSPSASARPPRCRCPTCRSAVSTATRCACPAAPASPPTSAHIRRGIGWGVAIKNLMYSEGFDDYSTARCRLADGVATLKFATAEVGQGFVDARPADRPHRARRRRRACSSRSTPPSARPARRRRRARRG